MSGGAPQQVPAFYKVLLYRNRRNGREAKRYKAHIKRRSAAAGSCLLKTCLLPKQMKRQGNKAVQNQTKQC